MPSGASATGREALSAGVRGLRSLRREIEAVSLDSRQRERLLDQLRFEVEEIARAGLVPGEDDALRREQRRLASVERLLAASATALEALDAPPISEAAAALEEIAEGDPDAGELAAQGVTLEQAAADLGRSLRAYRETLEDDPERRDIVEARLDAIARLRRKYGESVEAILQYEDSARQRLDAIETASSSLEELRERADVLASSAAEIAASLSLARREAATRLIAEVSAELARLDMPGASLAAGFACEDAPGGLAVTLPDYEVVAPDAAPSGGGERGRRAFTESGVDQMELLASFNRGSPPRPLRTVASGGETSRFLLALTTVLGAAAEPRLVVLDEVDEGVGGRAGSVVGEALRRLAERHQVLCVTHLPQVAAYGARHFVVTKASDGARTWSDIEEVEGEARLREMALMLGGDTPANRAAASDLLEAATE